MERLTERYTATEKPDGESDVWVRNNDYIKASEMLADYEDTGLTPEHIMELKARDTAKAPHKTVRHRGGFELRRCPDCGAAYQSDDRYTITDEYCPTCGKLLDSGFEGFCANCGQRIKDD